MLKDKNHAIAAIRFAEAYIIGVNLVLTRLLESVPEEEAEAFRRAVGLTIGRVDSEILDPLYTLYPDLEPAGYREG